MKNIFRKKRMLGAKHYVRLFFGRPLTTGFVIERIVIIFLTTCWVIFLLGNGSMQVMETAEKVDSSTISVEHTESSQQSEPSVSRDESELKSQSKEHDEEVSEMENEVEVSEMENEVEVSEMEDEVEVSEKEDEVEVSEMENEVEVSEMEDEVEVSEMENEVEVSEMEDEVEVSEVEDEVGVSEMEDNQSKKKVDTHVISGIKGICQFPELPTGCEVTALTCLMNYWGINVGKYDMAMNYMPRENLFYEGDTLYGPNPIDTFVGDPSSDYGFGCFAGCLVRTFERYILTNQELMEKYIAIDLTGQSLESILQEYVAKDCPVLVIVSPYLREPYKSFTWKLEDGGTWTWETGHHAMVIYGFDLEREEVYVADSVYESGIATYPLTSFEEVYIKKGMSAMTILSK